MRRFCLLGVLTFMAQLAAVRLAHACKSDTECKGDRVCEAGQCISPKATGPKSCRGDKECVGNDVCEQSICVSPTSVAPTSGAVAVPVGAGSAPGSVATAPGPGGASPSAMPSPEPTTVPATPAAGVPTAGPVGGSPPVATATATPQQGPVGSASGTPALPTVFKSIGVLRPDTADFFGINGHADYRVDSWSSNEWAMTAGLTYGGLFYVGDLDMTVFTTVVGATFGIHPAVPKTLSFALRGGAIVTATKTEFAGMSNTAFSAALLAGGEITLGYLMFGAEGWIRDGSSWMLRGGFAW